MPPWFIIVVVVILVVGMFVGPFYEALRARLGLPGRVVHIRKLEASTAKPALPPKRTQKARKRC